MSGFGFYAPIMGLLAALAAPLVLFYFLKLKRPRRVITSLVLWKQVIQDSRVNSPFQKFKRNLLLVLQLILLALLVLAATQPYWRGGPARVKRLPILIDCSASMGALDKAGGVSRLDEAKRKVREIIDGMLPDQELCLVAFSRSARRVTDFSDNRKVLLDALDSLSVEDVPSDLEDALRMIQAIERTAPFEEVMLFTDGNVPEQVDFELSFTLRYQRLDPGGANLGITSLNAKRTGEGAWDVFARVEASASAERSAGIVEFLVDGAVSRRESVALGKGEAQRLVFRVPAERPASIEVKLIPDGFDALPSDNRAWLSLPALRLVWVYAPASLASYRHALETLPGVRLFPDEKGATSETSFDLAITDGSDNAARDARVGFHVGVVPEALRGIIRVASEGTSVVDWQRNAPVLQHVELNGLLVLEDPRLAADAREGDLENLGFEALAHGTHGPLLLERRAETVGGRLDFYLLFHTDRSTLPYRVGFPVLVSNLVRIAVERSGLSDANAPTTGVLSAPSPAGTSRTFEVRGPDGGTRTVAADASGRVAGIPAPVAGVYTVRDMSSGVETTLGASLLSTRETSLAAVENIRFNENLAVSVAKVPAKMDKALWQFLALLAFGMLLAEWLYYHRSAGWFVK